MLFRAAEEGERARAFEVARFIRRQQVKNGELYTKLAKEKGTTILQLIKQEWMKQSRYNTEDVWKEALGHEEFTKFFADTGEDKERDYKGQPVTAKIGDQGGTQVNTQRRKQANMMKAKSDQQQRDLETMKTGTKGQRRAAAKRAKAFQAAPTARLTEEQEETTSMNESINFFEQLSQANKNPLASLHEARLKKISLALKKKAVGEGSAMGSGAIAIGAAKPPADDRRFPEAHGAGLARGGFGATGLEDEEEEAIVEYLKIGRAHV